MSVAWSRQEERQEATTTCWVSRRVAMRLLVDDVYVDVDDDTAQQSELLARLAADSTTSACTACTCVPVHQASVEAVRTWAAGADKANVSSAAQAFEIFMVRLLRE